MNGASVLVADAVLDLFGDDNAAGAILIGAEQPLLVTSRTYNDSASGTYGQFIAGRSLDDGVAAGESPGAAVALPNLDGVDGTGWSGAWNHRAGSPARQGIVFVQFDVLFDSNPS